MINSVLSTGQRAQMREVLLAQRGTLAQELGTLQEGASRVQHARDVLLQDGDDAQQRDADREVDFARTDQLAREISAVDAALERLERGEYGRCSDCDAVIPFDRLRANPHAIRCIACETAFEARQGGSPARASY